MSATQFKNDLTKRGETDEPKSSSNAGMNLALVITLALSLLFVLWGLMATNHDAGRGNSSVEQFDGQLRYPNSTTKTPHTTFFNGRQVSDDNDKSYEGGGKQLLQAPPPSPNVPYGQ